MLARRMHLRLCRKRQIGLSTGRLATADIASVMIFGTIATSRHQWAGDAMEGAVALALCCGFAH
jgi:hypothetical protein